MTPKERTYAMPQTRLAVRRSAGILLAAGYLAAAIPMAAADVTVRVSADDTIYCQTSGLSTGDYPWFTSAVGAAIGNDCSVEATYHDNILYAECAPAGTEFPPSIDSETRASVDEHCNILVEVSD